MRVLVPPFSIDSRPRCFIIGGVSYLCGADMLKQVSRAVIVIAVLLALASPVWANSVNVILDDPTLGGGQLGYFLPPGTTGPYSMMWQSCGYPPTDPTEPASHYTACLAIVNNTGSIITDFSVTIDITDPTSPLLGDTFSC